MLYFLIGALTSLVTLIILSIVIPAGETFAWVQSYLPSIQAVGSLAILASATVALSLFRATTKRHIDEDKFKSSEVFLSEAKSQLEKAYQLFSGGNDDLAPENTRVHWLTVARMIVRYNKIKKLIKEPPHIDIIEENEEFWRHKFYTLLNRYSEELTFNYFMSPDHKYGGDKTDIKSIAVIFDFAAWKGPDPLNEIDDIQLFADRIKLHDHFGLQDYLKKDGYWDKVLEKQSAK